MNNTEFNNIIWTYSRNSVLNVCWDKRHSEKTGKPESELYIILSNKDYERILVPYNQDYIRDPDGLHKPLDLGLVGEILKIEDAGEAAIQVIT